MEPVVKDFISGLAIVVYCHNPRYPIHIPLDIPQRDGSFEEMIFSHQEDVIVPPYGSGFVLKNYKTLEMRFFSNLPDFCIWLMKGEFDFEKGLERVEIAAGSLAYLIGFHKDKMEEQFGPNFVQESTDNRKEIQTALKKHPNKDDEEVRMEYLTKMIVPPEEKFTLKVVEEEDD